MRTQVSYKIVIMPRGSTEFIHDFSQTAHSKQVSGGLGWYAEIEDSQQYRHTSDCILTLTFGTVPIINNSLLQWLLGSNAQYVPSDYKGAHGKKWYNFSPDHKDLHAKIQSHNHYPHRNKAEASVSTRNLQIHEFLCSLIGAAK